MGRRPHSPAISLARLMSPGPDFTAPSCRIPAGRELHDKLIDHPGKFNAARARAICETCPHIAACAAWVLADEHPAGAWGGMYGGMDAIERVALAS